MFRLGPASPSHAEIPRTLDERIRSVSYAAMAYWFYRWDWGEAIALDGIDFAATGVDDLATSWVDREVGRWVSECADQGGYVSPMGPLWAVVRRYIRGDWELASEAAVVVESAISSILSATSTTGALTTESDSSSVYVDSLYGLPVALAGYALHTRNDELLIQTVSFTERHVDLLQSRELGFLAHYATIDGSGPQIWWGRGNGWGALGLADLVATIGPDSSPKLTDSLRRLLLGLAQVQRRSGEWRNLVAEKRSYPEASTTALVTAAFAVAEKVMAEPAWVEVWERGWASIEDRIDPNGHLVGVSYRPGVNVDPARYEHTPVVGSYPWGQGAWLRAAAVST